MGRVHGAKALDEHYSADGAEKGDVGQRDHKVELAYLAQQLDELHADDRAANAAEQQHCTQAQIDIVSAPLRQRTGYRGGHDLIRLGADRYGGGYAVKNQERGH